MHDVTIKQAKPGDVIHDDQVKGLQLRAFDSRKSFYLYFRTKLRVERRPKLGDYPTISLAKARELAREMLNVVAEGKDPVVERDKQIMAPVMTGLWNKFKADVVDKKKSKKEDERRWKSHIEPKLGKKRAADIELEDIERLHKAMADKPYEANRVVALISTMLNHAERYKWRPMGSNPCRFVKRYPEKARDRYMAGEEPARIAEILKREEEKYPDSVAFIYLLIMTGARKSEIGTAKPEWLNGSTFELPDSKTGAKLVHLPPQVMTVLDRLPKNRKSICGIKAPDKFWRRIREEAGCPDLHIHDLRHSFASAAIGAGLTLAEIGELLGHRNVQTTKRYAHLMRDAAQASVTRTADALEQMMKPAPVLETT